MRYLCCKYLPLINKCGVLNQLCDGCSDPGLPAAPALIPATLSKPVELGGVTYRVVEKRLDWTGALLLCESFNGTLASVNDPYQQAYLTLLMNSLHRPAWIALYNYVSLFFFFVRDHYQRKLANSMSRGAAL